MRWNRKQSELSVEGQFLTHPSSLRAMPDKKGAKTAKDGFRA
jgi:hypothetical protein